jgi:hypothetical protein
VKVFKNFCDANEASGDVCESLFLAVILIRIVARELDNHILPLDSKAFEGCSVSLYDFSYDSGGLRAAKKVSDYMSLDGVPSQFPHITIYRTRGKFNEVDLIVDCWSKHGEKSTYCYQFEEANKNPKKNKKKTISFPFDKCWWIGKPAQAAAESSSGMQVADEKTLQEFFGMSGCHWTPKAWGELNDEKSLTLIIK